MTKTLTKALIGAFASGLTTLFITAFTWSMPHGESLPHESQHLLSYMTKKLDLTDEQQTLIQPLLARTFEETGVDAGRLRTLSDELIEQPEAFDEVAAQTAADEIGQLTSRMVYRMASTHAAIYQMLDDEQKLAMTEMDERRGERRDRGHQRHRFPF